MTVILLRHASAGDRTAWQGDDRLRPLDERGRKQALELVGRLRARGVERVVSSPYVRCTQTVAPLGLEIGQRRRAGRRPPRGGEGLGC